MADQPVPPGDVIQLPRGFLGRYGDCFAVDEEIKDQTLLAALPMPWAGGSRWVNVSCPLGKAKRIGVAAFDPFASGITAETDDGPDPMPENPDETWKPV